jgi:hypothetical protein
MSEEDKEKDSDKVKPLEVKPGGKEKGTIIRGIAEAVRTDKK